MSIASNLRRLRREIEETARGCGRSPEEIELLAVSKTFPASALIEAREAGQRLIGENRVQEAAGKIEALRGLDIEWHLVGHLQSNKARRAVELFDVIQSLDSEKIILKVGEQARQMEKKIRVCLQINIGLEPGKSGASPEEAGSLADLIDEQKYLQLVGLMAIPPLEEDPEQSRPYFEQLRRLRDGLNRARSSPISGLSMGMSHDFEVAIQEGATLVRIGTALFGRRD